MPIRFVCTTCGKNLRVADEAAGQWVNCPSCQAPLEVPRAAGAAFDIVNAESADLAGEPPLAAPAQQADLAADRRPCPMCGEMIAATAAKCRFCGEVFDSSLRTLEKRKRRLEDDVDANLTPLDWVLAILCSGIGCIVGLVYVGQGKSKGWKMVGISMLLAVFWNIVLALIGAAGDGGHRGR
jgi:predicted RNA-binding Zn-ribbon protein involved in translation (DUF1610 family)